jgi:hypothetical protein
MSTFVLRYLYIAILPLLAHVAVSQPHSCLLPMDSAPLCTTPTRSIMHSLYTAILSPTNTEIQPRLVHLVSRFREDPLWLVYVLSLPSFLQDLL